MSKKKKRVVNAVEFFGKISDDIADKVIAGEIEAAKADASVVDPEVPGYDCTGPRFDCGSYGCQRPDNCAQDFRCGTYKEPDQK
ncbi:MAG TPA: hypothetical protein VMW95_01940 [Desulfobacterales bacterium]|nr:hypothetical protein [Desulfobacterales bacterium]